MRSLVLASAVLIFASASTGCAVLAAKAPDPDRPRDRPPLCNDGKGGVVVDGIMTTTLGVIALAMAADGEGEGAAIVGLGGLAYGLSAASGNSSANKCKAAHDEYLALLDRQEAEAAFAGNNRASAGVEDRTTMGGMPIIPEEDEDLPAASSAPPRTQPRPQPQPQPQPPPAVKAAPAPRAAAAESRDDDGDDGGEWSEFWKEVP